MELDLKSLNDKLRAIDEKINKEFLANFRQAIAEALNEFDDSILVKSMIKQCNGDFKKESDGKPFIYTNVIMDYLRIKKPELAAEAKKYTKNLKEEIQLFLILYKTIDSVTAEIFKNLSDEMLVTIYKEADHHCCVSADSKTKDSDTWLCRYIIKEMKKRKPQLSTAISKTALDNSSKETALVAAYLSAKEENAEKNTADTANIDGRKIEQENGHNRITDRIRKICEEEEITLYEFRQVAASIIEFDFEHEVPYKRKEK